MYQSICTFMKKQIAAILASQQPQVVKMMNVQRQTGGLTVGFLPLPSQLRLLPTNRADINSMRKHLYE